MRSSAETEKISPQLKEPLLSLCPTGFNHPKTRTHVRLLGPCFKTGRMKPYERQHPKHIVCILVTDSMMKFKRTASSPLWLHHTEETEASQKACAATPVSDPSQNISSYNTDRNQPPSRESYHPDLIPVDAHRREMRQTARNDENQRSIRIRKATILKTDRLNLDCALLIPCASLLTVSRTINFLFKVLFIFPSRYIVRYRSRANI